MHKKIRVAEAIRPGMCGMTSICATLANLVFQIDCEPIVNINPMLRRVIVIFTLGGGIDNGGMRAVPSNANTSNSAQKRQLMSSVEGSQYALIGVFDSQSNTTSIPRKPERIQTRPSPETPANIRDGQQASVVKTQS